MYHECRLVHADLSEYNILCVYVSKYTVLFLWFTFTHSVTIPIYCTRIRYHNSHLYIIDVSQSVEHDHPSAFDFLRSDIKNVDEFWARRGAGTLGLRKTFEFVVADSVAGEEGTKSDESLREALKKLIDARQSAEEPEAEVDEWLPSSTASTSINPTGGPTSAILSRADIQRLERNHESLLAAGREDEQLENAVFMRSYIPRNLNEVYDPERDAAKVSRGEGGDLIYGEITGIVGANKSKTSTVKFEGDHSDNGAAESDDDTDEEESEGEGEEEKDASKKHQPRGHRHEDKDAKKVCRLCYDLYHSRLDADFRVS